MDPESLEGPKLMISDLGESTLSDEPFYSGTYGYQNAWAPEVRRGRHYSAASDVYAMGCLIAKIVKLQWDVAERKEGINIAKAPKVVVEVMRRCLIPDPEKRISADEAYGMLESSLFDDEDGVLVDINPVEVFSFDEGHPGGDEEIPL
jgi:serine/threonine protein kinase